MLDRVLLLDAGRPRDTPSTIEDPKTGVDPGPGIAR
jgi:hypothetical protein